MSIFEDKKYNDMDWLAQAVEPIVSSLNDELAAFPAEFEFTYDDIAYILSGAYSSLSINHSTLMEHGLRKLRMDTGNIKQTIANVYVIRLTGQPQIDLEKGELYGGTIKLIRTLDHFDEKTLLILMGQEGIKLFNNLDIRSVKVERANEILELMGGHDALLKSKSIRQKCSGIHNALADIMANNKWNIRNVDLSNRVCQWVHLYLRDGNLAALTNFCKFKVMTHEGSPIYSIQEESI